MTPTIAKPWKELRAGQRADRAGNFSKQVCWLAGGTARSASIARPLVMLSSLWQQDFDRLVAETSQWSGRDVSRLARLGPTGRASLHVTQRPGLPHFASRQIAGFGRQNGLATVHSQAAEVPPSLTARARCAMLSSILSTTSIPAHITSGALAQLRSPLIHFPDTVRTSRT